MFTTSTLTLVVTFDQQLVPKALGAGGPWTIRTSNMARGVLTKTMSGATATLTCSAGIPDAGPDLVDYHPPPNNIEGLVGTLPAAAFDLTPTVI